MKAKNTPVLSVRQRQSALAKIHIAAEKLAMAEESYRALLLRVGGVDSAAKLSDAGIHAVLVEMQRLGFTPTRPKRAGKKPTGAQDKQALLDKIDALLAEMQLSVAYADGIARNMFISRDLPGRDRVYLSIRHCTPEQLSKIIAALEYQRRRNRAK